LLWRVGWLVGWEFWGRRPDADDDIGDRLLERNKNTPDAKWTNKKWLKSQIEEVELFGFLDCGSVISECLF
jgi:hypothetical protein